MLKLYVRGVLYVDDMVLLKKLLKLMDAKKTFSSNLFLFSTPFI